MRRLACSALALASALVLICVPAIGYAQPAPKLHRVGWLAQGTEPGGGDPSVADFRQGMRDLRYVEGKDFAIEPRYANGKANQLQQAAAELVRLRVDVIVTSGEAAAQAAKRATTTIPIVAIEFGSDPVRAKLVANLGRPEANLTGIASNSDERWPKRLQYLKEIAPKVARVAILWNPDNAENIECERAIQAAGRSAGIQARELKVRDRAELDHAFAALVREPPDAMVACWDSVTLEHARSVAAFARERKVPTIFPVGEYVQAGGLLSYGPDLPALRRRAAYYVDKLRKGAKPADLPMELAENFYLVMNQTTAKAMGLTLPPALMFRAEEIVQ